MSSWIGPLNVLRVLIRDYLDWERGKGVWVEDLGIKPPAHPVPEGEEFFDEEQWPKWERDAAQAIKVVLGILFFVSAALGIYILYLFWLAAQGG
jgi:hypothetical protein